MNDAHLDKGIAALSKEAFEKYAAVTPAKMVECPDLNEVQKKQIELAEWQNTQFDNNSATNTTIGVSEEVGELTQSLLDLVNANGKLSHAILKREQKIRDMKDYDKFISAASDAIADILIYTMNLCTMLRLDFFTLLNETAKKILKRRWKK